MPVLGPLDRRTQRKRCVACTRRKIKCEGGSPCLYCTKKQQRCIPQLAPPKTEAVFVNASAAPSGGNNTFSALVQTNPTLQNLAPTHYKNVPRDKSTVFIQHFFSAFLVTNDFGGDLDEGTIIAQFQTSSSLYHALVAVGALDLSKKFSPSSASKLQVRDATVGALTAYRASVVSFQKDIGNSKVKQNDASLWTTFFLGLFELMYDNTGDGFVKHFLYGTSKILQLRSPQAHLTGSGRAFFLTVRVFEICRSLIYSEPTFLCEPRWIKLMERIWDDSSAWHPKEALFDLMIACSSLSHRVWDILKPDSIYSPLVLEDRLQELAVKGHLLRAALNNWHVNFKQWPEHTESPSSNSQFVLAMLYFHAISIFLSGIFDYRPQFNSYITPSLPQDRIQDHVDAILLNAEDALKSTTLGGILFFFPLRVAGARVTTKQEAATIVRMLNEISKRSFVVADAFVADLNDLWLSRAFDKISAT